MTSDFPGPDLLLSIMARSADNLLPIALALSTPPTSGATQTILFDLIFFFMCPTNVGAANKLSTGISKNPWI